MGREGEQFAEMLVQFGEYLLFALACACLFLRCARTSVHPGIPDAQLLTGLARRTEEQCRDVRTTSWTRPGFEKGKADLGPAQYRTETWPRRYRHTAVVMAAHSFPIGMELSGERRTGAGDDTADRGRRRTGT